ncbi:hypothetical protein TNCV_872831 [Trichonephila clavipes]|nr:hypothetical protein TNCV_872831 [Trichonephila clavipes]
MYTVLCLICESLINSRPLTYVTDDVEDLEPLTPAMFLQDGREIGGRINPRGWQPLQRSPVPGISNGGAGLQARLRHKWTPAGKKPLRCSPVPVFLMGNSGSGAET